MSYNAGPNSANKEPKRESQPEVFDDQTVYILLKIIESFHQLCTINISAIGNTASRAC